MSSDAARESLSTLCAYCDNLCRSPEFSQAVIVYGKPLTFVRETTEIRANASNGCLLCNELVRTDHGWGKGVMHNAAIDKIQLVLRKIEPARIIPPQDPVPDLISIAFRSDSAENAQGAIDFHVFALEGGHTTIRDATSPSANSVKDDPCADFITTRMPNLEVNSPRARRKAQSWLHDCVNDHLACKRATQSVLPTRVIDLSSENPRLHSDKGALIDYACLSYCWGGEQVHKLTNENLTAYYENLPVAQLPQTLQDAFIAARNLGFQYLWIDSLCIIQNNNTDRDREIANMSSIYKNAAITIVAASAKSASEGFLHTRNRQIEKPTLNLPLHCENGSVGVIHLGWQQSIHEIDLARAESYSEENPVENRAWILQEKLLSRRMLHYSAAGLVWICQSKTSFDGVGWLFHPGPQYVLLKHDDKSRAKSWRDIVSDYSRRLLSDKSDKLRAISALAREYNTDDDLYLAGLWRSELPYDLLWYAHDHVAEPRITLSMMIEDQQKITDRQRHPFKVKDARFPLAGLPTWSWTSVDIAVDWYRDATYFEPNAAFELLECVPQLTSSTDVFANVNYRCLRIRAAIVNLGRLPKLPLDGSTASQFRNNALRVSVSIEDPRFMIGKDVFAFLVGYHIIEVWKRKDLAGILLCKSNLVLRGVPCFQRVGYFRSFDPQGKTPEFLTQYSIQEIYLV